MIFVMNFFELFVRDVGVNLCSGDGAVAEHFLDGADVGAIDEQLGGVAVTEGVRGNFLYDAGPESAAAHEVFDADSGESALFVFEDVGF